MTAFGQKQSVMHDRIQPIAEIGDEACRLDRRGLPVPQERGACGAVSSTG